MNTELRTSICEIRLDWSEMDLFGHINNVMYFKYLQSARVAFWEKNGLAKLFKSEQKAPVLASVKCDFIKPLHYPGLIQIRTCLESCGTTSFVLQHQILSDQKTLCAEGRDVLVMYDYLQNEKIPVPEMIRKLIPSVES